MNSNLRVIRTPEFKQFLRENPGLVRKFWHAYKNGLEKYEYGDVIVKRFEPGVESKVEGGIGKNGMAHHKLWTVKVGERTLVVKETLKTKHNDDYKHTGFQQFRFTKKISKLAEILRKLGWKHDLKEVPCHLGADYGGTSFLVTEYSPFPRMKDVQAPPEKQRQVYWFLRIADLVFGASDLLPRNIFYDAKSGTMYFNDLVKMEAQLRVLPVRIACYACRVLKYGAKKILQIAVPKHTPESASSQEPVFRKINGHRGI